MKQCDSGLAPPFSMGSSFGACESDPEDSFWSDFTFDFSFLASEDQKNGRDGDDFRPPDSTSLPKAAAKGDLSRSVKDQRLELETRKGDLKCADAKPPSLGVVSKSRFLPNATLGEGRLPTVASGSAQDKEACCCIDVSEMNFSPLFSKMSAPRVAKCSSGSGIDKRNLCSAHTTALSSHQDDSEVNSPCWRRTRSHDSAASRTMSLSYRRSSDDLNPLAPQFIPFNPHKSLDKNVKDFGENSSSSFKKSPSSIFPPPSREFIVQDPSQAHTGQGSCQNRRIGIPIHDTDECFGCVSQDSFGKPMSILDATNGFQTSKRLDPLAPLFVPASVKQSAVVHEKHKAGHHMAAIGPNAHSTYASSSSDDMLLNNVKVETHSSDVNHSFRNPYSNSVRESGTPYSFSPRLGSQVQISEYTKLGSFPKKLNPLAPQYLLKETKSKVYGCEKNEAATHLLPKLNSSLSSLSDVKALSDFCQRHGCSTSSPSPKMDVKKLLTTIHGLSELLIRVAGSESSDSPNEQDLDIIYCTVQNLNSYISSSVREHTGSDPSPVHSSCDIKSLPDIRKRSVGDHQLPRVDYTSVNADVKRNEKYAMVSGEMVPNPGFAYSMTKENGFGKIIGNHQTEEQINPHMFFYRSLWLKAKADMSLMEYEKYLSKTRA